MVELRGLDIIGTVTTPGLNGIVFNTGQALHIDKRTIREFLNSYRRVRLTSWPTAASSLFVTDTRIINNGSGTGGAVSIKPSSGGSLHGTISGVFAFGNVNGIVVDGTNATVETAIYVNNTVSAGAAVAGISAIIPTSGGAAVG
ncbi:hypothetical protein [Bradyrhizobium sp. S69]|uniref:hypothetical protein n=1 Tax=Bradyrhizobium sp. S69 TaxID=1641856 RepID=UPI00131EA677|nr:hypothetical protein [Bradyrhizobium sp. S69]